MFLGLKDLPYAGTMAFYRDLFNAHYQDLGYLVRIREKQAAVSF